MDPKDPYKCPDSDSTYAKPLRKEWKDENGETQSRRRRVRGFAEIKKLHDKT